MSFNPVSFGCVVAKVPQQSLRNFDKIVTQAEQEKQVNIRKNSKGNYIISGDKKAEQNLFNNLKAEGFRCRFSANA